jgi:hypothetical protein
VITKFSWRRALAVPAALTLALGGVLLTSTTASAAPGDLVVTSPAASSAAPALQPSRTVTIAGTAVPGASIRVFANADRGVPLAETTTDTTSGAFSTTVTYADDARVAQSVFVDGFAGGSGFSDPVTRAFLLPPTDQAPNLVVTSPTDGQELETRTVTVTGTGIPTANVNLIPSAGDAVVGQILVDAAGDWTGEVTFPDDAIVDQSIQVTQVQGGAGRGDETVAVTLPAAPVVPAPAKTVTLDTPREGTTTDSREVVFAGTAPVGSTVVVTAADGTTELGRQNLGTGSTFSIAVAYDDAAALAQTVTVSGFVGGSGFDNTVTRNFALPAVAVEPAPVPVLDVPVITAPVNGEVVTGDRVTFQGTGTPGSDIGVIAVPTAELEQLEAEIAAAEGDEVSTLAQPDPQPAAVDPAERVIVGEDGTWSVTVATTPGDYTAVAISALVDGDGVPVLDASGAPIVAGPSNEVEFSVVAAAIVPAGTTPVVAAPAGLAYTGSDGQGLALGLGAALTLAGTGLAFTARRRARLAAVSVSDSE